MGAVNYLATMTRPDIAFTVGLLACFSSNPGPRHWTAALRLLRYLKHTAHLKLTYHQASSSPATFITYSDAAHMDDKDGGYSTGAYLVTAGGAAVSWRSKLQTIITRSTTEAEYIAAADAGCEIIFLRNLLKEFGFAVTGPSPLMIDN